MRGGKRVFTFPVIGAHIGGNLSAFGQFAACGSSRDGTVQGTNRMRVLQGLSLQELAKLAAECRGEGRMTEVIAFELTARARGDAAERERA